MQRKANGLLIHDENDAKARDAETKWILRDPIGNIHEVSNLAEFCSQYAGKRMIVGLLQLYKLMQNPHVSQDVNWAGWRIIRCFDERCM